MQISKVKSLLGSLVFVSGFLLSTSLVSAQTNPQQKVVPPPRPSTSMSADKSLPQDDGPPLTTFEEEMRAKRAIKLAEKDHQQNLDRAREISQLAKELQQGLKDKSVLGREDLKRVERLEKLTKKIRGEAGGEDDEVQIVNRPSDITSAVTQIAEVTESLSKSVQNTPRQVISASVIDSANVLLELIRILRTLPAKP
jgi:hypothetical protein